MWSKQGYVATLKDWLKSNVVAEIQIKRDEWGQLRWQEASVDADQHTEESHQRHLQPFQTAVAVGVEL